MSWIQAVYLPQDGDSPACNFISLISLTVYTIYTVSEFIKSLLMQLGHTAVLTLHFKCSTGERFYGDAVSKRNVPLMSDALVAFLLYF